MDRSDGWILLVEDDPETSAAFRAVLETHGHRVVHARGGFEAMCRLELEPGRPGAVVLDLDMPGVDGLEFYRRKARLRACATAPVIVVSGSEHLGRARFGDDVRAVLRKPVDVPAFVAVVDGCVRAATPRHEPGGMP